jgi:hypothetical protein
VHKLVKADVLAHQDIPLFAPLPEKHLEMLVSLDVLEKL